MTRDGQIAQQGSYADLRSADGYVLNLALEQVSNAEAADDENVNGEAQAPPKPDVVREDSEALDLKRQTGDVSLYTFYFKSASVAITFFWLGLAIIYTGLSKIPRKCPSIN